MQNIQLEKKFIRLQEDTRYNDKRALRGWKKIVGVTLILLLLILFAVQQAFDIPVFEVVTNADDVKSYSASKRGTARLILGLICAGLFYGIYLLFSGGNYSFTAMLEGGERSRNNPRYNDREQAMSRADKRISAHERNTDSLERAIDADNFRIEEAMTRPVG